jgi:hypothetical protein
LRYFQRQSGYPGRSGWCELQILNRQQEKAFRPWPSSSLGQGLFLGRTTLTVLRTTVKEVPTCNAKKSQPMAQETTLPCLVIEAWRTVPLRALCLCYLLQPNAPASLTPEECAIAASDPTDR